MGDGEGDGEGDEGVVVDDTGEAGTGGGVVGDAGSVRGAATTEIGDRLGAGIPQGLRSRLEGGASGSEERVIGGRNRFSVAAGRVWCGTCCGSGSRGNGRTQGEQADGVDEV